MIMKYLDPKAYLPFKRVFGGHKDLLVSLLNALLPFEEGEEIVSLEYLSREQVPNNPMREMSFVNARCKDNHGREFVVEMQVAWTPGTEKRMYYTATDAYVHRLYKEENYDLEEPVYVLIFTEYDFMPDCQHGVYNHYPVVNVGSRYKFVNGLQLVLFDLTKFSPQVIFRNEMAVLWLRFLTEINENMHVAPKELLGDKDISRALKMMEEDTYTESELYAYDDFWDAVRIQKSLMYYGSKEYYRREGYIQGRKDGIVEVGKRLKSFGMPLDQIKEITKLSDDDLQQL